MLTFDHALEDWQDPDNPVTGPRPGPASSIDWWILHYRGVPGVTVPPTLAAIFQALRNAQHWWTHRPTNRFSLGYNDFLISCEGHPNDGEIIEGRGLRFRGAATGGINDICWATQIIQRDGEPLSPKARARCRERSLELRAVFPLRHGLADHGRSPSTTVTSCAGPGIRADIDAGLLWADEPSPDEEDDDMSTAILYRHPRYHNVFLVGPGGAVHLSPGMAAHYRSLGLHEVTEAHDQALKSALATSGTTSADLVRV